ncbi:hypothetical protein GCM10011356_02030 [Kangiella profundi]|nr:hypothetical protein GCM10011356_02030 [Kangiella profundi]
MSSAEKVLVLLSSAMAETGSKNRLPSNKGKINVRASDVMITPGRVNHALETSSQDYKMLLGVQNDSFMTL